MLAYCVKVLLVKLGWEIGYGEVCKVALAFTHPPLTTWQVAFENTDLIPQIIMHSGQVSPLPLEHQPITLQNTGSVAGCCMRVYRTV